MIITGMLDFLVNNLLKVNDGSWNTAAFGDENGICQWMIQGTLPGEQKKNDRGSDRS